MTSAGGLETPFLSDTIAAIATPAGRGGIGIVRVSGPDAQRLCSEVAGQLPRPRYATLASFADKDGRLIDRGLVLSFPAPNSFTGEDVVEFHGHGGPVVMDLLLSAFTERGARIARPGEFSERAFLCGKLDLTQAEAIADLIDSGSAQAARSAVRSLQGEFANAVRALVGELTHLRMFVEAAIDFPEEEVDFLTDSDVIVRSRNVEVAARRLLGSATEGSLLTEGMTIVLLGEPNAGKSSLLNALCARAAAIVTALPGTTRDPIREAINLDGIPVHLVDTAGMRDARDEIEAEGIKRSVEASRDADHVLIVVDGSRFRDGWLGTALGLAGASGGGARKTVVVNKSDILAPALKADIDQCEADAFVVSALTGDGLDDLKRHIKVSAGAVTGEDGLFSARRRHVDALAQACGFIGQAVAQLGDGAAPELFAEDLRLAQDALAEITGEFAADDLLGQIFSSFCIGK